MNDATANFFDRLGQRVHEPALAMVHGTCRFDIWQDGQADHWLVSVERGDISASHVSAEADCVIGAHRALFNAIVEGKVYLTAAVMRNEMVVEGDPRLVIFLERLFPGRPSSFRGTAVKRTEGSP